MSCRAQLAKHWNRHRMSESRYIVAHLKFTATRRLYGTWMLSYYYCLQTTTISMSFDERISPVLLVVRVCRSLLQAFNHSPQTSDANSVARSPYWTAGPNTRLSPNSSANVPSQRHPCRGPMIVCVLYMPWITQRLALVSPAFRTEISFLPTPPIWRYMGGAPERCVTMATSTELDYCN